MDAPYPDAVNALGVDRHLSIQPVSTWQRSTPSFFIDHPVAICTGGSEPLCGFFYVTGRGTCIAVRGRGNTGLITARTTAGGRPLGPAPANAGGGGVLQLFTHAIQLSGVRGTEATTLESQLLAVTSTSTAHIQNRVPCSPH
jgi:hypothetical protein